MSKTYLGDDVWAEIDADGQIILTEKVGGAVRDLICLELDTFEALAVFVARAQERPEGTAAEREFDHKCNEADTRRESGE